MICKANLCQCERQIKPRFFLTEVTIVTPIKDKVCSESENVTYGVEVSHPGIDAFWTFNGQPLKAGPKYKMVSKGKSHSLTVLNAMKDEEGEYMFAAGEKSCSATLTVSGILLNIIMESLEIWMNLRHNNFSS